MKFEELARRPHAQGGADEESESHDGSPAGMAGTGVSLRIRVPSAGENLTCNSSSARRSFSFGLR